jgi:hypothetical protein
MFMRFPESWQLLEQRRVSVSGRRQYSNASRELCLRIKYLGYFEMHLELPCLRARKKIKRAS